VEKINYTVLHYFNDRQAKSYAVSHQHLDIIFNLHKSIKIGIWSKYQDELINNILTLLSPYLLLQKHNCNILLCDVTLETKQHLTYNELRVIVPINKDWYYKIKLVDYHELTYIANSSIIIQKKSLTGDDKTIYYYNSMMNTIPKLTIYNDDEVLGFFKSEPAKIRLGLCYSCEYFANSTSIMCAVNPYVRAKTCFDCKDYQLNSTIDIEEFEQHYKFE
jgi:hypothetical protein